MTDQNSFFGPFAALRAAGIEVRSGAAWHPEVYDVMETLEADLPLWLEQAKSSGSPILELGCGTGRVALPLARAGFRVLGVDADPEMLARLRAKLEAEHSAVAERVELRCANALQLDLDRRFRLAILANNFLNYFDLGAQRQLLRAVARHLEPGGRLVLDVYSPRLLPRSLLEGLAAVTRLDPATGATLLYLVQSREQVADGSSWLNAYTSIVRDGGVESSFLQCWRQQRTTANELRLLLREAGFAPTAFAGGYEGRALDDDATQIVAFGHLPPSREERPP